MDKGTQYFGFIFIICIVSILYIYILLSFESKSCVRNNIYTKPNVIEGFGGGTLSTIMNIFRFVIDATKFIAKLPFEIADRVQKIGKLFTAFPNAFGNLVKKTKSAWSNFTDAMPAGFHELKTDVITGMDGINKGAADANRTLNTTFSNLIEGITNTIKDIQKIFVFIEEFFVFLGKYIYCGIIKIFTMPYCIFFYALEAIGYFIYMPVLFGAYIIHVATGFDTTGVLNQFWDIVYFIDDEIDSVTGYHLFRYSPGVIKQCYSCDLNPMPTFPTQVFVQDFDKIVSAVIDFPSDMINAMDKEMIPAFTKLIKAGGASVFVTSKKFYQSFQDLKDGFGGSIHMLADGLISVIGQSDLTG
jgi:hypothetical protein